MGWKRVNSVSCGAYYQDCDVDGWFTLAVSLLGCRLSILHIPISWIESSTRDTYHLVHIHSTGAVQSVESHWEITFVAKCTYHFRLVDYLQ
jgi:hypothetical protein